MTDMRKRCHLYIMPCRISLGLDLLPFHAACSWTVDTAAIQNVRLWTYLRCVDMVASPSSYFLFLHAVRHRFADIRETMTRGAIEAMSRLGQAETPSFQEVCLTTVSYLGSSTLYTLRDTTSRLSLRLATFGVATRATVPAKHSVSPPHIHNPPHAATSILRLLMHRFLLLSRVSFCNTALSKF